METSSLLAQPLTLTRCLKGLLLDPARILEACREGRLEPGMVLRLALGYSLIASLAFGFSAIIRMPAEWQLTQGEMLLRFSAVTAMALFFFIPLFVLLWAVLQKGAAWFTDGGISFGRMLGIAGLSTAYWALMFLLGLPVFLLSPLWPQGFQFVPFLLMLSALGLTLRLFQTAYQVFSDFSSRRSLWAACLPFLILLGFFLVLRLMVWVSVVHHQMRL